MGEFRSYADRWQDAVMAGVTLQVVVPVASTLADIAERSGIVGHPDTVAGMTVIDFEGNLHGAVNLGSWAERVHAAAGRAVTWYPTTARRVVLDSAVHVIGTYRCDTRDIVIADVDALRGWLAGEVVEVGAGGIIRLP